MMNNVSIRQVSKTFEKGSVRALTDISMEVHSGELFGLIGPDGAGKTTLFRILATLLLPEKGAATVCGFDVVKDFWDIRKIVGYMPGRFSLYQDLSVEENLNFFASVFKTTVAENYDLVKDIYVQLEPFKKRPAGKLSGGMKQKLALCCALIHEPRVLFLDEPTTGVDPVSRREFWDMLQNLKKKGITIIVSTPYMDEAGRCDRIGLIQNGQLLDTDTLDRIIEKHKQQVIAIKGANIYKLMMDIRNYEGTLSCFTFGESLHVRLKPSHSDLVLFEKYLEAFHHEDVDIQLITPGIEDVFITLMQEKSGHE